MIKVVLAGAVLAAVVSMAGAADKPDARASATIQGCIKSAGDWRKAARCIGNVSDPCLNSDKARSTADMVACIAREEAVWDDILNETYRRLREKLDATQQGKLRDMQRAWIASREKTCAFYWDFFQGTMASPMSASCVNEETARRALFLLGFLEDTEAK
jgi:uncharacterized protein YecT (DUF1311 family)